MDKKIVNLKKEWQKPHLELISLSIGTNMDVGFGNDGSLSSKLCHTGGKAFS
jgi:hypothetical protein